MTEIFFKILTKKHCFVSASCNFLTQQSGITMPVISMFCGLIITMYFFDNKKHHLPHIHVKYQNDEAVFSIPDEKLLEGSLLNNKERLVVAWIEIHKEDLIADWQLASEGQQVFKIDPLK